MAPGQESSAKVSGPTSSPVGNESEQEQRSSYQPSDLPQSSETAESVSSVAAISSEAAQSDSSDDDSKPEDNSTGGDSDGELSNQSAEQAGPTSKKKKKKKKKRKQPKAADDAQTLKEELDRKMLPPEVADKRYTATMEAVKSKDELCLWVQLGRCRLNDKKARKLLEALKSSASVTSIDLSDNYISDEGMQLLATTLACGTAPDLISLDVRGNPMTEKGRLVLSGLQRVRKLVKVDFEEPSDIVGEADKVFKGGGSPKKWNNQPYIDSEDGWTDDTVRNGQRDRGIRENVPERVQLAIKAIEESSLALRPAILANRLRDITLILGRELKDESARAIQSSSLDRLPQGLRLVTQSVSSIVSVLDIEPAPVLCQQGVEVPAIGRHRIQAVEIMHRLALPCCEAIDEALLSTSVVKKIENLFFAHPRSSIFHGPALRFFEVILSRPDSKLCQGLFDGPHSFPNQLAEVGLKAGTLPLGQREGYSGHVIALAKFLQEIASKHEALQVKLSASEAWTSYAHDGGTLQKLLTEQSDGLCGPKPDVPSTPNFLESETDHTLATLDKLRALFVSDHCCVALRTFSDGGFTERIMQPESPPLEAGTPNAALAAGAGQARPPWRKVLYLRQPYNDAHTDPSFLAGLVTNANVVQRDYWTVVRESVVVIRQLAIVVVAAGKRPHVPAGPALSAHALLDRMSTIQLLVLDIVLAAAGFVAWVLLRGLEVLTADALVSDAFNVFLLVSGVYIMSPILQTLTRSISSDTIWTSSIYLLLIHLFFHDYSHSHTPSSKFTGNVSLLAACLAFTLLASRLQSPAAAFALILLVLEAYVLFPVVADHVRHSFPGLHLLLTSGLAIAAIMLVGSLSRLLVGLFVASLFFIGLVCPYYLIHMQKHKFEIQGPWDEAKLTIATAD
eukprot:SM000130S27112  [mRNA]  locus=s130:246825:254244:- [translate_table: standard]